MLPFLYVSCAGVRALLHEHWFHRHQTAGRALIVVEILNETFLVSFTNLFGAIFTFFMSIRLHATPAQFPNKKDEFL